MIMAERLSQPELESYLKGATTILRGLEDAGITSSTFSTSVLQTAIR